MLQRGCLTGPCQPTPGILTAPILGARLQHPTGLRLLHFQVLPPEHYALWGFSLLAETV